MSVYQSKANSDENFFFGKITDHLDPESRKMLVMGMLGNTDSTFYPGGLFTCYRNCNSNSETENVLFSYT